MAERGPVAYVRELIAYAFPFGADLIGTLSMPRDGLSRDEAERLKAYIESLVTQESEER